MGEDNVCMCGWIECEYKENEFYWHEVLDRSFITFKFFHDFIKEHPAVEHDEELCEITTQIFNDLNKLYQMIGSRAYKFEKGK